MKKAVHVGIIGGFAERCTPLYSHPMLLVCTGPDTFQALRKAQELERAYREKYDPSGLSVERLTVTAKSLETVAERVGTMGLFAQRRCLRATGLVASWKKADWERAGKVFQRDPEQSIVISLEEELAPDAERTISTWERSRAYRHPVLAGADFQRFAGQLAQEQGLEFDPKLQRFAQQLEGDSWAFWNALPRWKATKTLPDLASIEASPFLKSEDVLLGTDAAAVSVFAEDEDLLPLILQQARQGLRVVAQQPDPRMPAFAQKKWQRLTPERQARLLARVNRALEATVAQRLGAADAGAFALLMQDGG